MAFDQKEESLTEAKQYMADTHTQDVHSNDMTMRKTKCK